VTLFNDDHPFPQFGSLNGGSLACWATTNAEQIKVTSPTHEDMSNIHTSVSSQLCQDGWVNTSERGQDRIHLHA
jgi:hypothetical protein